MAVPCPGLLHQHLDADSDNDSHSEHDEDGDPNSPWKAEFWCYLNTVEALPQDMDIIEWWGVCFFISLDNMTVLIMIEFQLNLHHYPTWASLARDYLSGMGSSVLSERAFLSVGITITKHCNWLKGDIVEAMQCLKSIYHNHLLFQEVLVSSKIEGKLDKLTLIWTVLRFSKKWMHFPGISVRATCKLRGDGDSKESEQSIKTK